MHVVPCWCDLRLAYSTWCVCVNFRLDVLLTLLKYIDSVTCFEPVPLST